MYGSTDTKVLLGTSDTGECSFDSWAQEIKILLGDLFESRLAV